MLQVTYLTHSAQVTMQKQCLGLLVLSQQNSFLRLSQAHGSCFRTPAYHDVHFQLCAFSRLQYTLLIEPSHGLLVEVDALNNFVCMLCPFTQAYSVLLMVYVCMNIC